MYDIYVDEYSQSKHTKKLFLILNHQLLMCKYIYVCTHRIGLKLALYLPSA